MNLEIFWNNKKILEMFWKGNLLLFHSKITPPFSKLRRNVK